MSKLKTLKGALQALQEAMWGNKESRALVPLSNADEGTAILSPDGKETFDLGRRAFLGRSADAAASPMLRGMFPRGALSTLARQVAEEGRDDLSTQRLARLWRDKYAPVYDKVPYKDYAQYWKDSTALSQQMLGEAGLNADKVNELLGTSVGNLPNHLRQFTRDAEDYDKMLAKIRQGRVFAGLTTPGRHHDPRYVSLKQLDNAEEAFLSTPSEIRVPGQMSPLQKLKFIEALTPGAHTAKSRADNALVDLLMDHSKKKTEWADALLKAREKRALGYNNDWAVSGSATVYDFEPSHYARKRLLDAMK